MNFEKLQLKKLLQGGKYDFKIVQGDPIQEIKCFT